MISSAHWNRIFSLHAGICLWADLYLAGEALSPSEAALKARQLFYEGCGDSPKISDFFGTVDEFGRYTQSGYTGRINRFRWKVNYNIPGAHLYDTWDKTRARHRGVLIPSNEEVVRAYAVSLIGERNAPSLPIVLEERRASQAIEVLYDRIPFLRFCVSSHTGPKENWDVEKEALVSLLQPSL